VVRRLEAYEREYCKKNGLNCMSIGDKGVKLNFKKRGDLGSDLTANIFAGIKRYKENFIVVDMGTSTTFSVVGKGGKFLGVSFVAGVEIVLSALWERCDLLPEVALSIPKKAIGKTTESAMLSGVFFGYVGLIKEICSRIQKEVGEEMKIILTGGYSKLFIADLPFVEQTDENLTFEGIKMIYERNR
jgi:type III pantothenate kinase